MAKFAANNEKDDIMEGLFLALVTFLVAIYATCFMVVDAPESISATYYMLGKRGWIFQTVMILVGFLLMPAWISIAKEQHIFLAFLSCASLMFVAAAPAFRLELEGKVHYASAAVCCTCAVFWQILEGMWNITV